METQIIPFYYVLCSLQCHVVRVLFCGSKISRHFKKKQLYNNRMIHDTFQLLMIIEFVFAFDLYSLTKIVKQQNKIVYMFFSFQLAAYYKTWPGPIGLASSKVGLASFLASILALTEILAWPQKLTWTQIWPQQFFWPHFFFQNSDIFRDVLIMISMIDLLFV